jgi:hypothetical protein
VLSDDQIFLQLLKIEKASRGDTGAVIQFTRFRGHRSGDSGVSSHPCSATCHMPHARAKVQGLRETGILDYIP